MDTDASPLKMALLNRDYANRLVRLSMWKSMKFPWGLTLKGCEPEHADELEKIVKTL